MKMRGMKDKSNPLKAVKTSPLPIKIDYEPTWGQRLKKHFTEWAIKTRSTKTKGV